MHVSRINQLPDDVEGLALLAEQEGYRFLRRLCQEFSSKTNCFDKPGEALFAVYLGTTLAGIGGVNCDPYSSEKRIGRVRRFYIHPQKRRLGIGRVLLMAIEDHARNHFHKLHLFTDTAPAALFYERLGYVGINGISKVSHLKSLRVK